MLLVNYASAQLWHATHQSVRQKLHSAAVRVRLCRKLYVGEELYPVMRVLRSENCFEFRRLSGANGRRGEGSALQPRTATERYSSPGNRGDQHRAGRGALTSGGQTMEADRYVVLDFCRPPCPSLAGSRGGVESPQTKWLTALISNAANASVTSPFAVHNRSISLGSLLRNVLVRNDEARHSDKLCDSGTTGDRATRSSNAGQLSSHLQLVQTHVSSLPRPPTSLRTHKSLHHGSRRRSRRPRRSRR